MSINIKEIFQSDNLSVSQDKINYNFDQILANGGGPQGLKGDKGSTGALGSVGDKGEVGAKGEVGPKGNTGADGYFTLQSYDTPIDQHTLLPKTQPTGGSTVGERPTNLVLGRTDTSYTEDTTDKNTLLTLVDENNGANFTDLIRLRLKSGAGAFNATSGVVRMIPGSGGARLKIAAIGGNNTLEFQSNDTLFNDGLGATKLRITNSFTEASGNWNFLSSNVNLNATSSFTNNGATSLLNNNTIGAIGKFNNIIGGTNVTGDFLKINPTGSLPAPNKILVSADTNGGVYWKNPTEIQGIYPQGSIMFVNPTEITDTYFSLTVYDLQPSLIFDPNAFFFGRGKAGTRWAGWYLLMGQTNAWYSSYTTLFSYVPTNVPGSIIIGASGPDDKVGVTSDEFDSSMGIKKFNSLTPAGATNGYGVNYQPQLRGTYNGVGSNNSANAPRDLTNFLDNEGTYYDTLAIGSIVNPTITGLNPKIYPDRLSFMPLPMAVYLGRTDLTYNYSAGGGFEEPA